MREFTCSCRLWQLNGIPCTHAIATINKNGQDVSNYVSRYYLRSTMSLLYENVLYPINGMDNWPRTSAVGFELAPPRTKRQRGRPKKLRREEPQVRHHENGAESLRRTYILRCRRCGQEGHNRRTCTNDPRVDARTEVRHSSSQATDPSTSATGNRAESSNSRQNQETTPAPRRGRPRTRPTRDEPSEQRYNAETNPTMPTSTRNRANPQCCGRRGDQD